MSISSVAGIVKRHSYLNWQKNYLILRKFYFYVLLNDTKKVCGGLCGLSSSN